MDAGAGDPFGARESGLAERREGLHPLCRRRADPSSRRAAAFLPQGIASMLFGRIPVVGIFGRIDGAKHPQEELVSKAVVFHLADGIMRAAAQSRRAKPSV